MLMPARHMNENVLEVVGRVEGLCMMMDDVHSIHIKTPSHDMDFFLFYFFFGNMTCLLAKMPSFFSNVESISLLPRI